MRNKTKNDTRSQGESGRKEAEFRLECRDCPRLARHLDRVRADHPGYYAHPVPSFGDEHARLLIVGLAPGLHGANRTGRPFTGDFAGILLYDTLYRLGLSSQPGSDDPEDGLRLLDCRIANAVKCLPPENRPTPAEVRQCNHYLAAEIARVRPRVVLALGRIAHDAVLMAFGIKRSAFSFGHGAGHRIPRGPVLLDSYHCSRYNTQTRRLTEDMFESVVRSAIDQLDGPAPAPVADGGH